VNQTTINSQGPKLTSDEVNAIYCCISFSQDLRDAFDEGLIELKLDSKGDNQSKKDFLSEKILTALNAANKLAGYNHVSNRC